MRTKWPGNSLSDFLDRMVDEYGLIPSLSEMKKICGKDIASTIQYRGSTINKERKLRGVYGLKKCTACCNVFNKSNFRIRKKYNDDGDVIESFVDSVCKHCSRMRVDDYRNSWRGVAADMVRRAKYRSKKMGWEFNLTKKFIYEMIESNGFKCNATGLPLKRRHNGNPYREPFTASLDRVDSCGFYTVGNVQVVCNWYNWTKSSMTEEEILWMMSFVIKKKGMVPR